MPTPPERHRAIARHVAASWGSKPRVEVWSAQGTPSRQAIAMADNFPERGVRSFSTIGLSDKGGHEIASVASMRNANFVKVIFDLASYVLDGYRRAEDGATFEKLISRFYSRAEAGHLFLTSTPLPQANIDPLRFGRRSVKWLYGWPVTSDELIFMESMQRSIEGKLAKMKCDTIIDLNRSSLPGVPHLDPWAESET